MKTQNDVAVFCNKTINVSKANFFIDVIGQSEFRLENFALICTVFLQFLIPPVFVTFSTFDKIYF